MPLDHAAKAVIALETDPEKIISNFELYCKQKITRPDNLSPRETHDSLTMMKYLTISHINVEQGGVIPFEEAMLKLENYIKMKEQYTHESLHDNNKRRCPKRYL